MACELLEVRITAGFSRSGDSSLGSSSLPRPWLRRLREWISIQRVWWHCRAVQNHHRYSLLCGFLLGEGACFQLRASVEKQVRCRWLRWLLLKDGSCWRKAPHPLPPSPGRRGLWSPPGSRGGVPGLPAPGSGTARAGLVSAPCPPWGSRGAAGERSAGTRRALSRQQWAQKAAERLPSEAVGLW